MTTTRTRPGYYVLPRYPVAPVEPVTGCDLCDNGCHCEMGTPGCEHFGCWGTPVDDAGTCPSAAAHRDNLRAWNEYRRDLHAYETSSYRR